ncbi:MAG: ABC transporter substrate-binding protein [Planctomycetota bacterium]
MNAKKWLLTGLPLLAALGLMWTLKTTGGFGSRSALKIETETHDGRVDIEDSDGFRLTFHEPPSRVLPCNASIVDLLLLLIDPEKIVALPEQADTWSLVAEAPELFAKHPRLSRYLAEPVIVHRPDLVIVSQFNTPDTNARLRDMDIPLLRLPIRNTFEDVIETLHTLSSIFRAEDRLVRALAKLEARRAALAKRVAGDVAARVLFYSNYGTGGWTYGDNSTVNTFIEMAGLKNAAGGEGGSGARRISYEEVLTLDPDLIIVSSAENGAKGATRRLLETSSSLKGLRALKNGALIELSPRLAQASSQEMLSAAEVLAKAWSDFRGPPQSKPSRQGSGR